MANRWENRIVGSGEESPQSLMANPKNARKHPPEQRAALRGALSEIGWIQDVIVNRQTGFILDGHARVEIAIEDGEETVPVKYIEIDESQEALALTVFDPIAAMANVDRERMDSLVREVETGDEALLELIADIAEEGGILDGLKDGDDDDEEGELSEADVRFSFGDCHFTIYRDDYNEWIKGLRKDKNFSKNDVIDEVKRRLGFA